MGPQVAPQTFVGATQIHQRSFWEDVIFAKPCRLNRWEHAIKQQQNVEPHMGSLQTNGKQLFWLKIFCYSRSDFTYTFIFEYRIEFWIKLRWHKHFQTLKSWDIAAQTCRTENALGPRLPRQYAKCLVHFGSIRKSHLTCTTTLNHLVLVSVSKLLLLYCPAVFGHFSPAPVKTDRAVRIQQTNQVKVNLSFINQSINQPKRSSTKGPPSEKLPHGDDFRVGPKSDRTPRDNTVFALYEYNREKRR